MISFEDICTMEEYEGFFYAPDGSKFLYESGKLRYVCKIKFSNYSKLCIVILTKEIRKHGYIHRINSSALEYTSGKRSWHLKGKMICVCFEKQKDIYK